MTFHTDFELLRLIHNLDAYEDWVLVEHISGASGPIQKTLDRGADGVDGVYKYI